MTNRSETDIEERLKALERIVYDANSGGIGPAETVDYGPHPHEGEELRPETVDASGPIDAESLEVDKETTKSKPVHDITHPDYGAVGDGSTDDTAAIEAALKDALATGGKLYVPNTQNYYRVTSEIIVTPTDGTKVAIEGDSRAGSVIQGDGLGSGSVINFNGDFSTGNTFVEITIRDVTVHASANGASDTTRAQYPLRIEAGGLRGVTVENVGAGRGTDAQIKLLDCFVWTVRDSYIGGDNTGDWGLRATNANLWTVENTVVNNISSSTGFGFGISGFYGGTLTGADVENSAHGYWLDDADAESNSEGGIVVQGCSAEKLDASQPDLFRIGENATVSNVAIIGGHYRVGDGNVNIDRADRVYLIAPGFGEFVDLQINDSNVKDVAALGYYDPNDRTTGTLREIERNRYKGSGIEQDTVTVIADGTLQRITSTSEDGLIMVAGEKNNTDRFCDVVAGSFHGGGSTTTISQDHVGTVGGRSYNIDYGDLAVSISDGGASFDVTVTALSRVN